MSNEVKDLVTEVTALRRVLGKLVELKKQKDSVGKSSQYEHDKSIAWDAAELVLNHRSALLLAVATYPQEEALDVFLGFENFEDSKAKKR